MPKILTLGLSIDNISGDKADYLPSVSGSPTFPHYSPCSHYYLVMVSEEVDEIFQEFDPLYVFIFLKSFFFYLFYYYIFIIIFLKSLLSKVHCMKGISIIRH